MPIDAVVFVMNSSLLVAMVIFLSLTFAIFIVPRNSALDSIEFVTGLKYIELSTLKLSFSWWEDSKDEGIVRETLNKKVENASLDCECVELIG